MFKKVMIFLKNLFHYLYQKKLFSLLIFGFIFTAIVSWTYLNTAINKNIDFRLEHELNTIVNAVNSNIFNHANTIGYVQAYFKTEGMPSQATFRRLAESIEIQQVNHGIQGLGYISIVKKEDLQSYIKEYKNKPFFNLERLQPGREIYAPITMIEPMSRLRSTRLGYDMLQEESRREAILQAIQSSTPTISKPLTRVPGSEQAPQASLILLMPFYKTIETPLTPEERMKQIRGVIYIPMRMRKFFEATLGPPELTNERVNFKISYLNDKDKTESILYQRFEGTTPQQEDRKLARTRTIDVYGHKWKVTVAPFPSFFYFGDRYLVGTVAFCFILFISLLVSLFKQTQNLLTHEKKTKELMEATIRQGHEQTKKLKILNEVTGQANLDLDITHNADDFFSASLPLSHSSHALLFLTMSFERPEVFSFYRAKGFVPSEIQSQSLSLDLVSQLLHKSMLFKNEKGAEKIFSHLINTTDIFSDWVIVTLPSRELRRCGLLFLGRTNGKTFTDNDIELIEGLVSQFGIRLDNLRLFKKVEDANKVKTAFLSNMSHEIRTPLNAINGFSEILEKATTTEEKSNLIEGIRKNTSQLTNIIDNILEISKIEFGRIFINKKSVSISALAKSIQDDMAMRAVAKGLKFEVVSIGPIPSVIETDESRVRQILLNLIGNAIKFTEEGAVKLQVSCDISRTTESFLNFSVSDTGIGISAKSQSELFQSFSQLEASHTRRFGGIGLGLALSRRLAQQFGGDVTLVRSALDEGSTFNLRIPCGSLIGVKWIHRLYDDLSVANPNTKSNPPLDLKDKKVLIVEDSEDNQEIFQFFLSSAGAKTEVIDNGEDAVKKAQTNPYDLILMDIQLPKMDGLEATRRIRSSGFTNPIIALTAHASAEEKINCLKAGCIDLITKPVTQVTLIKRIQTIIEEQNYVR